MKPPCKVNGKECKRRYVGCQSRCADMKIYQLFHALEMKEKRKEQFKQDVTDQSVLRMQKRQR